MAEPELHAAAETLNTHLQMRTYFVGYSFTEADHSIYAGLVSSSLWSTFKRVKYPHLVRWYSFADQDVEFKKTVAPLITSAAPAALGKEKRSTLPDLPGASMGTVVTRFPPEPSGYLHIGHCKAALINFNYAKKYNGRFIVRFDDTNPNKEKDEFVESILDDLKMMGILPSTISHTSDYFDKMMDMCVDLIKRGLAYCDATPVEEMRRQKMAMEECEYRTKTVEENLAAWEQMKIASEIGCKYIVRAKIDMKSLNGTLRDPAIYRVNNITPHIRTGRKYNVYPLYDFSCPIVDSIEGVTHVMRSNEFHDRDAQYAWLLSALNLSAIPIVDFSRLNFTYQLLSKRKLQWFVDQGRVAGWDDPRFPTIKGMLRRGLRFSALEEFILAQGASKNLNLMDMSKLWALNKATIDPIVPRYTAVAKEGAVIVKLSNGPASQEALTRPRHKKNPDLGTKVVQISNQIYLEPEDANLAFDGEEVTLMDWGNCIFKTVHKNAEGKVTEIEADLNLAGDFKKTKRKLTWLAAIPDSLVPVKLLEYDHLITKPSLSENDNFEDFINNASVHETLCLGDANLRLLQKGDSIQLERRGYFICEKPYFKSEEILLIAIPDGAQSGPSILSHKVTLKTN